MLRIKAWIELIKSVKYVHVTCKLWDQKWFNPCKGFTLFLRNVYSKSLVFIDYWIVHVDIAKCSMPRLPEIIYRNFITYFKYYIYIQNYKYELKRRYYVVNVAM